MPGSFFEKLKICIKPGELVPLICESFSRKDMVRLIAAGGCIYPGIRMEKLTIEELASGWVEDAWEDPQVFAGLVQALDKVHENDMERLGRTSLEEIRRLHKSVEDICRRRDISGLIWAMLRDERSDAALIREFFEAFYRVLDKSAAIVKREQGFDDHLWQGKLNKKETEKVRRMLLDLIEVNKEARRRLDKTLKGENKLKRQVDDLKKKVSASEAGITALKNELAGLRKEADRKDILIRELERRAKTISRKEENILRRRIHDLERNERKLQHETAELNDKLQAAGLEAQKADGLYREAREKFQDEHLEKEQLEQELKRLEARMAVVGQPGPAHVEKSSSHPKEKGKRLGIFIDTRYLWQASRFLRQKIDYQKLLEFIVLDRHLVKAAAYVMTAPEIDSSGFLAMLQKNGFHVRSRPFIRLPDGSYCGGWGAGIAADVIFLSEKLSLDIVHLVSGSEDFADLSRFLKTRGIKSEISGFGIYTAVELERAADEFVPFGNEIFKDSSGPA